MLGLSFCRTVLGSLPSVKVNEVREMRATLLAFRTSQGIRPGGVFETFPHSLLDSVVLPVCPVPLNT